MDTEEKRKSIKLFKLWFLYKVTQIQLVSLSVSRRILSDVLVVTLDTTLITTDQLLARCDDNAFWRRYVTYGSHLFSDRCAKCDGSNRLLKVP